MNWPASNRYSQVSSILAQGGYQVSQPVRMASPSVVQRQVQPQTTVSLTLQDPSKLFSAHFSRPALRSPAQIPAISSSFQLNLDSPRQQLMSLGQKYGVPYTGGDINNYQKNLIKTIIRFKAREHGIPEHIALGIAGNESGWKMWKNLDKGELVAGRNVRDGQLKSTDWGVMQINDKAHPRAFPRVKQDLEYNIEYGLSYLARQRNKVSGDLNLGLGDWDRTVASYNLGHNPKTERAYQIAARYVGHVSNRASQFA